MPLDAALDIYGSSITKGYNSSVPSRALRRNLLRIPSGAPGTPGSTDLQSAIIAWEAEQGLFHHVYTALPLSALTVQKFGPQRVLISANYQVPTIGGSGGNQSVLIADTETAIDICDVYRSSVNDVGAPVFTANGLPGGNPLVPQFNAQSEDKPPALKHYARPAARTTVRTTLTFNPFATVLPLYAHTNSAAVNFTPTLGLPTAGPESVLFEGCHVRIRSDGALIKFDVAYSFLLVLGKLYEQEPRWDKVAGVWVVTDRPRFPIADLGADGAFPY